MASPSVFDILILGAGIAGLATSIGLRQKGHQVTVLESTSSLRTLGGSLLVPPPSARVLDDFGVWGKFMEQEAVPPGNTSTWAVNFLFAQSWEISFAQHGRMLCSPGECWEGT